MSYHHRGGLAGDVASLIAHYVLRAAVYRVMFSLPTLVVVVLAVIAVAVIVKTRSARHSSSRRSRR